ALLRLTQVAPSSHQALPTWVSYALSLLIPSLLVNEKHVENSGCADLQANAQCHQHGVGHSREASGQLLSWIGCLNLQTATPLTIGSMLLVRKTLTTELWQEVPEPVAKSVWNRDCALVQNNAPQAHRRVFEILHNPPCHLPACRICPDYQSYTLGNVRESNCIGIKSQWRSVE